MFKEDRKKVQYFGDSGYTQPCILAISAILNSGILPERATIVTHVYDRKSDRLQEEHLFIFWNWQYMPIVVIPSGFASGYGGEGPKGFALAICMIREKEIPLDGVSVEEPVFEAIDKNKIVYVDDQVFKEIKAKSETLTWLWYDWVPEDMEEILERGQLHTHRYLQNYKRDLIPVLIGYIDSFNPEVGRKLRLAFKIINNSAETEDLQSAMIFIRDSWIEFSKKLCTDLDIDLSGILDKDSVIEMLTKAKVHKYDEKLFNLAKASFNLSMKHHKRNIDLKTAIACVISTIVSMNSFLEEVPNVPTSS